VCFLPNRSVCPLALLLFVSMADPVPAQPPAVYNVRWIPDSIRLHVTASVPIVGDRLRVEATRPAGIPELDSLGWTGLVTNLRVTDAGGRAIQVTRDRTRGWTLARRDSGTLTIEYQVDYAPLARLEWPAPREAVFRDDDRLVLVGRSLFVTTEATRESQVTFELPDGWTATTPWRPTRTRNAFVVAGTKDLVENLIVLARTPPDKVVVGDFHLHVFSFGHWAQAREEVRHVLQPVIRHYVATMRNRSRIDYVVVLLPALESGAESYRASFALNTDAPGPATSPIWGNLVAHEIFHLWNGWLLRGADYASTQWFQEGFTEYAANIAIAASGLVEADWLRAKLATHVQNARRLETTLENTAGRKGPPLYSAGALVAFGWDVQIRAATHGKRNLGDFFRELFRRTDGGRREYAWTDLRAALEAVAPDDWEDYYQLYVRGNEKLPIQQALATVGLRMVDNADGTVRVDPEPGAKRAAKQLWAGFVGRK
jgi:predicted metalloprotease with PDZ domain